MSEVTEAIARIRSELELSGPHAVTIALRTGDVRALLAMQAASLPKDALTVPMTFNDSPSRSRRLEHFATFCERNADRTLVSIHDLAQLAEDVRAAITALTPKEDDRG